MSIEDEARKKLERRKMEKKKKELDKIRKKELEKQHRLIESDNQLKKTLKIIRPLKVEKLLREIKNKHWCGGDTKPYYYASGWKSVVASLLFRYEGVKKVDEDWEHTPSFKIRTLQYGLYVKFKFISDNEIEIEIESHYPSKTFGFGSSGLSYHSKQQFGLIDESFENLNEVKDWLKSELAKYIILITDGEIGRSNVLTNITSQGSKDILHYKQMRGIKTDPDPKGCWGWLFG